MTACRCFCGCSSALRLFWRRRIGAMADHRHHGEGEHHQRDGAVPPMPGSALVVIESELVFRGLKTVLKRPPMAFGSIARRQHSIVASCAARLAPGTTGFARRRIYGHRPVSSVPAASSEAPGMHGNDADLAGQSPPTARRTSRHPLHSGGPRGVHRHPLGVVSGLLRSLPPVVRHLETLPVGSLRTAVSGGPRMWVGRPPRGNSSRTLTNI